MARPKKTAAAPQADKEELLKKALVPEDEQPYTVPSNWCWVRLGTICNFERGITFPASSKEETATHNNIACLRTANVQEELDIEDLIYINKDYIRDRHAKLICKDDIVMSIANSRELVGKTSYIHDVPSIPMTFGAFLMVLRANIHIRKYIYYFLRLEFILGNLAIKSSQTVNIANISTSALNGYKTPFPPLPEQQRIVERIESLFSKLDAAKEKIQNALDGCELRKAAILKKAFNGELTEQWRKEQNEDKTAWRNYTLKESCEIGSGGTPSRKHPEYYIGNIPWVKTGEINWNEIVYTEEKINEEAIANSSAKIYEPGAVLVAMYGMGMTRGRAAMLNIPAATNQAVCALIPKSHLHNKYLYYYFMFNYWKFRNESKGGNQLNLSAKVIAQFQIQCPSVKEQKEIVRLLDGFFDKERTAKEASEQALEQIEYIKKSILAKAFRGELGTNDPQDESSLVLLKQIIETGNS